MSTTARIVPVDPERDRSAPDAHRETGSWSPLAAVDYRTRPPRRRLVLLGAALAGFMLTLVVAQLLVLDRLISPLLTHVVVNLWFSLLLIASYLRAGS